MDPLWVELSDSGVIIATSPAATTLLANAGLRDFADTFVRRRDLQAAVTRRSGGVRFGLGEGAQRRNFDVVVRAAGTGAARLDLVEVNGHLPEAQRADVLLDHCAQDGIGFAITDADGYITWADDTFAAVFRESPESLVGTQANRFRVPEELEEARQAERGALHTRGTVIGTMRMRRTDGEVFLADRAYSAVLDESGRTVAYACSVRDLTWASEVERVRNIDEALTLLGRVAGDAAHAINNLAAQALGTCEAALLSTDPASAGRALDDIRRVATQLGTVGHDLLWLAEPGVAKGPADLGRVARRIGGVLRAVAGDGGPMVQVLAGDGPLVTCAPDLLVRACIHVAVRAVSAAAAANDDHPVRIESVAEGDRGVLRVHVNPGASDRDTLLRLFNSGVSDQLLMRGYLEGVRLDLDTDDDGALVLRVSAPLAPEATTARQSVSFSREGARGRLLVAEDNDDLRELFAEILRPIFSEVVAVEDGEEAWRALENADGNFELVVLDLRMPKINGLDVMARALPRWPHLRIVVVSGAAPEGIERTALSAGARAVLSKPFHIRELRATVRLVLADAPL